ncbi:eukaryotic translation initiation factor 3 subunit J [Ceratina calcarata]|uniref:Eukaryotic translation initiation factor 3 subunit J n=1 Tax=Ceratina calcarata TaxID=156304 RepID=A0AAJ7JF75_9HYME|nr:eukaryotic translation initiation factor 3 subunit J [Ceratina calcarata]
MDDEWDVENAEAKFDLAIRSNKWEGEDEEEEVKDSWEDVEEEKKDVEKPAEVPKAKPKPKKALAERIEEREKKAREEAERKAKEKEESLSPEERRAEQLRRQRLQEEADLRLAMETFGVWEEQTGVLSLDATVPSTKEEFEQYGSVLTQKLNELAKNSEFPPFGEEIIKNVALNLSSTHLKKVKTMIDNLFIEKQKIEKGDKTKKNKGKGKAKLKIEGDNTLLREYGDYVYDECDDFM